MKPIQSERRGERGGRTGAAPRFEEPQVGPPALAACLFSLSFSMVLFTLALFKLLSFFIMPSLFFDLLYLLCPLQPPGSAYRARA
jgi:hypothetical protein